MSERKAVVLAASAPDSVQWTAEAIAAGKVVAMPTDTVYGLVASLSHPDAITRVFEMKRRDLSRVLPVLISSADQVAHLTGDLDPDVPLLLATYWPGPLTVVVPALAGMPAGVVGSDGTVGLRVPNHPTAIAVLERAGGSVACTSANRSGELPARTAADVFDALGDEVDLILDGGQTPGGTPSTVIRAVGGRLSLLRAGAIPIEHIRRSWRELRAQGRPTPGRTVPGRPSPGQAER